MLKMLGLDEAEGEEESEEVGEDVNNTEVGCSEELVGSTTNAIETPPSS